MKFCICFSLVLVLGTSYAFAREWTDSAGKHRVEADFISMQNDEVLFQTADGQIRRCSFKRLSVDDQAFIQELQSAPPPEIMTKGIDQVEFAVYRQKSAPGDKYPPNRERIRTDAAINVSVKAKTAARKAEKEDDDEGRRCAFLGRCGSFTVIGSTGTAAYMLGNGKYIADLASAGEDKNWWMYRPTGNGDPSTTMWAFARNPRCGKYSVLRFANGTWRQYEQTNAWGANLGGSGRTTALAARSGGPTNEELLNELHEIKEKLRRIQPGAQPSLQDLQNQIDAKR